jgi:hypothetical protein
VASLRIPVARAAETVKQHLKSARSRAVTVEGQCTTVVVATMLTDDGAVAGNQLCEAAGEVAYRRRRSVEC